MLKPVEYERFRIPRTLAEAFGDGAKLTILEDRRHWTREAAEYLGYIVAGFFFGGVIASVVYGVYEMIFGRW